MSQFQGVYTIMPAPFTDDGALDPPSLASTLEASGLQAPEAAVNS